MNNIKILEMSVFAETEEIKIEFEFVTWTQKMRHFLKLGNLPIVICKQ